jgi:hypothetical protein
MVLEDYGELMFLQTVLKKLGFDVDSIQNPRGFNGHVLSMNPDVLVMTALGKKVHGIDLSKGLRRVRGLPRVILLRANGQSEDPSAQVDAWLETPVPALTLLSTIGDLCGLNNQVLAEKFQKLRMQEIEEEKARVLKMIEGDGATLDRGQGANGDFGTTLPPKEPPPLLTPTTLAPAERSERYKKFLAEPPPKEHGFASRQVVEQVKALRRDESAADLADLERERKLFVEHLFRKKA